MLNNIHPNINCKFNVFFLNYTKIAAKLDKEEEAGCS